MPVGPVGGGQWTIKWGGDERDARESSPQPGRRLRGFKVTGRWKTERMNAGQKET